MLKRRLDLKLTQKQAAQMIGTNEWSIIDWEARQQGVSLQAMPKVINFLGYIPYDLTKMSLGEQISTCRKINGLTQEKLARKLNAYVEAIVDWEKNRRLPKSSHLKAVQAFIDSTTSGVRMTAV